MNGSLRAALQAFARLREFVTREVWETQLDALPKRRALRYRVVRIAYSMLEGLLWNEKLHVRSAALTYFSVLSIVPFLAFAFSLLKGFGAYDTLVEETIRPYVRGVFADNPALQQALERILDFVAETDVSSLGFIGLSFLLYAATRLLRNVEDALNELWDVRRARSLIRQITDYFAIMLITPICLLVATGLATMSQVRAVVRFFEQNLGLGPLFEWSVSTLGPLMVVFLGLVFLYLAMPNTRVRTPSAFLGAAIGSVLWYATLVVHVRFQLGVARFNALYSGFAALPIFLVWVYVQWLVVLTGAKIAATHQYERAITQRNRARSIAPAHREAVGLSIAITIARAFVAGGRKHPTARTLGVEHGAPEPLIFELVASLMRAGIVIEAETESEAKLFLARPPDTIRLKDVLDALRRPRERNGDSLFDQLKLDPAARAALSQIDRELDESSGNRSLRELVTSEEPSPDGAGSQDELDRRTPDGTD